MEYGELVCESFDNKQITWTIPQAMCLEVNVGFRVQSPSFSFADATWQFELYPYGRVLIGIPVGCIELMIVRLNSRIPKHHIFYKFSFKTLCGGEYDRMTGDAEFNSDSEDVTVKHSHKSHLEIRKDFILCDGNLIISCDINSLYKEKDRCSQFKSSVSLSDSSNETHPLVTLSDIKILSDLKELFIQQKNCDVTIKVEGQEFQTHRFILTRSSVFAATFRNDMKEKATGVIVVEDCDPSSFSDFLCFLYCGKVNLSIGNVFTLFTTADKYDVQDLRLECLDFIKKNLSLDIFCDAITLAHQHSEKELIELSTHFFERNLQKIVKSAEWKSFILENPIQGNELLDKAVKSKHNE